VKMNRAGVVDNSISGVRAGGGVVLLNYLYTSMVIG
jgi:hypothetical protein